MMPIPATSLAVSVEDFSLAFLRPQRLPVLENVTLLVPQGTAVAIVGPSGCGKTTLLRWIAGLLPTKETPAWSSGRVHIDGMSPDEARRARRFGFAFQSSALLPWLSVRRNLMVIGRIVEVRDAEKRIDELLDLVGMREHGHLLPGQISGGMRQRVNIARALMARPAVLLLDEPFASLDDLTRAKLDQTLLRLRRYDNPTTLLVTHNLQEACSLSDAVIVLTQRPATVHEVIEAPVGLDRSSPLESNPTLASFVARVRASLEKGSPQDA